jgi:hypothetical protein
VTRGVAIAKVMIRCTETNEPVYTGISMEESAFESRDLGTQSLLCPDCGQEHAWDKDDAELEDEWRFVSPSPSGDPLAVQRARSRLRLLGITDEGRSGISRAWFDRDRDPLLVFPAGARVAAARNLAPLRDQAAEPRDVLEINCRDPFLAEEAWPQAPIHALAFLPRPEDHTLLSPRGGGSTLRLFDQELDGDAHELFPSAALAVSDGGSGLTRDVSQYTRLPSPTSNLPWSYGSISRYRPVMTGSLRASKAITALAVVLEQRHSPAAAFTEIVLYRRARHGFSKHSLDAFMDVTDSEIPVSFAEDNNDRVSDCAEFSSAVRRDPTGRRVRTIRLLPFVSRETLEERRQVVVWKTTN